MRMRPWLASGAAGIVMALGAGSAEASIGDLSFASCFDDTADAICATPATPRLDAVADIAVSPDGTSLYSVASDDDDALSFFSRAGNGALAFQSCFDQLEGGGCFTNNADAKLERPRAVAVAPNGNAVYVVANAVTHYNRMPGGALELSGCLDGSSDPACGNVGLPLPSTADVTVSPDDTSVYVIDDFNEAIVHLERNPVSGGISYLAGDCVASRNVGGCAQPVGLDLDGADHVAVSPDGASVYVTARDGGLARFARAVDGTLTFQDCFDNTPGGNCATPRAGALRAPNGLAISPAGNAVYVGSGISGVAHFSRAANGSLALVDCVDNTPGNAPCTTPANARIGAAHDLALVGSSLYAVDEFNGIITQLSIAPGGGMTFGRCYDSEPANDVCPNAGSPSIHANAVAAAPASVYTGSHTTNRIVRFNRGTTDNGGDPLTGDDALCKGRRATILGTTGPDVLRGTRGPDVIATGPGRDKVRALGRDDLICLGDGRDQARGGGGDDKVLGQRGSDDILGNVGNDALSGGPGRGDSCDGGPGNRDRARGCERTRGIP